MISKGGASMDRKVAIISSLMVICAMVILLLGCPPPTVRVRPPEPRVEIYGTPPSRCCLETWPLGTQERRLGLDRWPLGVLIIEFRVKNFGPIIHNS